MTYGRAPWRAAKPTMWTQLRRFPSAMRCPASSELRQHQHDEHRVDDARGVRSRRHGPRGGDVDHRVEGRERQHPRGLGALAPAARRRPGPQISPCSLAARAISRLSPPTGPGTSDTPRAARRRTAGTAREARAGRRARSTSSRRRGRARSRWPLPDERAAAARRPLDAALENVNAIRRPRGRTPRRPARRLPPAAPEDPRRARPADPPAELQEDEHADEHTGGQQRSQKCVVPVRQRQGRFTRRHGIPRHGRSR